ncbi:YaiI/YqxD family protein [Marinicrinis sediminis]|uniref:UPF0178 protein ACFSUC_12400 n=1 Tax=Marinicrinis sediminis TaxID=1652465 RepID=A0ABW5RCD2_9BACL
MNAAPCIYVDADACPVKKEIIAVAEKCQVEVFMIASYDHHLEKPAGSSLIHTVQLDRGFQSVDMYIANHTSPGDVVITQDLGLAALILGKKATALSNRGETYTPDQIDFLLAVRHTHAKKRRAGGRTKGPKAMTEADRQRFLQSLTKILVELQENHSSQRNT